MIALFAAVAEETHLIRQSLQDVRQQPANGISVMTGRLCGTDICLTHSGLGKAAAAAAAVALLSHYRPQALWLFGCGGAYLGAGLTIGDLAIANEEFFGDEGVATGQGFYDLARIGLPMRQAPEPVFNSWPIDQKLYDWALPLLTEHAQRTGIALVEGPFVTVSTCTGTTSKATEIAERTGGICENMEGAAVALACRQLSVPMLEVRGISNLVEDRDTSRWDLSAGMTAAQLAIIALFHARSGQSK